MSNKKVAVILSGCGVYDGAEINEAVLTLLSIKEAGADYQCYAPDIDQHHVINHTDGAELEQKRNVLVEAARIARGNVKPIQDLQPQDYDALIVPGGFGVAKNLSKFAFNGNADDINKHFLAVGQSFKDAKKPAGYMCIAPALLPKIYGEGVICTIGEDVDAASAIENSGGVHENCTVEDVVVDKQNKLTTTPAYMYDADLVQVKAGISKLVTSVLSMS